MTLTEAENDLDSAYYVVQGFIRTLGSAPKLPAQVADWCLKIRLAWEMSPDGHETQSADEAFTQGLCDTAEVASILNVTRRQAQRLGSELGARKIGGVWLFPTSAVMTYAEEQKWAKSTQPNS